MGKLSKENYEKIIKSGLYKNSLYKSAWCRNGTFLPRFYPDDNQIYMLDSFWNDAEYGCYEVADDNISQWELVLDYELYSKSYYDNTFKYNKEDFIATQDYHGGDSSTHYYVKKGAKPNIDYEIEIAERQLQSAEHSLKWCQDDLAKLLEKKKSMEATE